jgi:hypothetical protein
METTKNPYPLFSPEWRAEQHRLDVARFDRLAGEGKIAYVKFRNFTGGDWLVVYERVPESPTGVESRGQFDPNDAEVRAIMTRYGLVDTAYEPKGGYR